MAQVGVAKARVLLLRTGLLAGLAAMLASPAAAVPTSPNDRDIERALQAESAAESAVTQAEARLAAAVERFDELMLAAARAAEAHNGAQYTLEQARAVELDAVADAVRGEVAAGEARLQLGRVAAAAYRTGGQLSLLGALIDADRPDQFVDGTAVLQTVTRSQGTIADLAVKTAAQARDFTERARQARLDREEAARAAETASEQAASAVLEFQTQVAALEREHEQALVELAEARGTTLALEEQRQASRARAAAANAEQVAAAPSSEADDGALDAAPTAEAVTDESSRRPAGGPSAPPAATSSPAAASDPAPPPALSTPSATARPTSPSAQQPSPSSPPAKSPPPPSGAHLAVDYAYAQLGKPYEWGAAGPDTFDCSGLTMRAWQQAGVYLPHWSVAQARIVTRVSYADLRPGDLVFWSDNGQASGTYHVGLYIGSGRMIHAPRPGKVVEIQSVFYWRPPSFYGRV